MLDAMTIKQWKRYFQECYIKLRDYENNFSLYKIK